MAKRRRVLNKGSHEGKGDSKATKRGTRKEGTENTKSFLQKT